MKDITHDKILDEKKSFIKNIGFLLNGTEKVLKVFKGGIFPVKHLDTKDKDTQSTERRGIKISTPKQILQRHPVVLAQVKSGNTYLARTINLKYKLQHQADQCDFTKKLQ